MKLIRAITFVLVASLLLATTATSIVYARPNSIDTINKQVEQQVRNVLVDGFAPYYTINGIRMSFEDSRIDNGVYEGNVSVVMNTTLKAKKVEELSFVKGMLRRANLNGFKYESRDKTDEAVMQANRGMLKSEQLAKTSQEINSRFGDLKQYINKADDNNFFLKVTAKVENDSIAPGSAKILAENIDTYVPIAQILPKSSTTMEKEGYDSMESAIQSAEKGYLASLYTSYNRLNARDYANQWSTNPSKCYDHGTSCGIRQARNLWNNITYPYYAELCHNDCADFTSQSIKTGGIPMDATWKRGSAANTKLAWVNTGELKNYMLNTKKYWKSSTFAAASAGGVLYTASDHVVVIVQNDTVTRKFSGHTNDRNKVNYSDVSSYKYYVLW